MILMLFQSSHRYPITTYSRFGPFGPRSTRGISKKIIQVDTPARLSGCATRTNSSLTGSIRGILKSLGVVNTTTLCETPEDLKKHY